MREFLAIAALLAVMAAGGCQAAPKTQEGPSADRLRFVVYNKKGRMVFSHALFRDGSVKLTIEAAPDRQDNSYRLGAEETAAAWQLAASVSGSIDEGRYFLPLHEECRVEIRNRNQVEPYEFTHDKTCPQAPEKLRKLMLILSGLSKW
jgi:hypothetical protein